MKNITLFLSALVALLFSVAETSAQISPPFYNPANVNITGGNINNTVIGGTTAAVGSFTNISASINALITGGVRISPSSGNTNAWFYRDSVQPDSFNIGSNWVDSQENASFPSWLINFDSRVAGDTLKIQRASAGGAITTIASFLPSGLSVADGKTLQVGSGSGTSAGLIAGYAGTSGYGALWNTSVTPSTTNYALNSNGTITNIHGVSESRMAVNGSVKLSATSTGVTHIGNMVYDKTITAPGTTGALTINKTTGRVNFAAAATSLVVTNSLATVNSICHVTKAANDATMRLGACVAAAGSITIYADVAPAAETAVNFTVTN